MLRLIQKSVRSLHSVHNLQNGATVMRRDREETNCWKKLLFLFSLRTKSILVASLNSDWTTDGRWSILTMLFILFWVSTVLITWQSMGQSQASRFSSKGVFTPVDRLLCSETGIKTNTMLPFILGAVRFYTAKFLNGPKLLIQVTCE